MTAEVGCACPLLAAVRPDHGLAPGEAGDVMPSVADEADLLASEDGCSAGGADAAVSAGFQNAATEHRE
jgi:hypothetical protein